MCNKIDTERYTQSSEARAVHTNNTTHKLRHNVVHTQLSGVCAPARETNSNILVIISIISQKLVLFILTKQISTSIMIDIRYYNKSYNN